jgi:hypothetical protein
LRRLSGRARTVGATGDDANEKGVGFGRPGAVLVRELSAGNDTLHLGVVEAYWTAPDHTSSTSTKVPNRVAEAPI